MIERSRLVGRKLTLLLIGGGDEGREEAATFAGTVQERAGGLWFVRENGETFPLKEDWLGRIEKAGPEARPFLLDADYFLSLEVGTLEAEGDAPDWLGIELEFSPPRKP